MFPDLSLVVPCAGTSSPAVEQGSLCVAVPPLPPPSDARWGRGYSYTQATARRFRTVLKDSSGLFFIFPKTVNTRESLLQAMPLLVYFCHLYGCKGFVIFSNNM